MHISSEKGTLPCCCLTIRKTIPSKEKNICITICTTPAQSLQRWSNIVQMLYKCVVFTGIHQLLMYPTALTAITKPLDNYGPGLH